MKESLKKIADQVPYPLGSLLGRIPMVLRLGRMHSFHSKQAASAYSPSNTVLLSNLKKLVSFAHKHITLYRKLYGKNGFHPSQLKTLDDITKIPIIDKAAFKIY